MSDVLKRTSRPLCLQQPASPPGSHDARCTCAGVVPAPFILLAGHYRPVSGSILLAFARHSMSGVVSHTICSPAPPGS